MSCLSVPGKLSARLSITLGPWIGTDWIRLLKNWLSSPSPPSSAKFTPRTAHARGVFLGPEAGAVVSQDHSAVSVSTMRLGVQYRQPKAASPPQELEVYFSANSKHLVYFIPRGRYSCLLIWSNSLLTSRNGRFGQIFQCHFYDIMCRLSFDIGNLYSNFMNRSKSTTFRWPHHMYHNVRARTYQNQKTCMKVAKWKMKGLIKH
jgi:hypothetical protein